MRRGTVRYGFRDTSKPSWAGAVDESSAPTGTSRAARMLALAHHVERLVEAGQLESVAAAARSLGLTRARMTQVMNLLLLAPGVQEELLVGRLRVSERALRCVVAMPEWSAQQQAKEAQ